MSAETEIVSPVDRAERRFRSETKHHAMEIVHDDGLHRHLRFVNPDSSLYWFEITTTPGQLVFSGDGESFVFRAAPDMFKLFRESASYGGVNAGYWAEKVKSSNAYSYSEEAFREYIEKAVAAAEGDYPGLREDVQEEILESLIYDVSYEAPAMMSAVNYSYIVGGREFRFRGTWEWDVKDFDWWYLFACHAIGWGIRQYDAAKAASPAAAVEAVAS